MAIKTPRVNGKFVSKNLQTPGLKVEVVPPKLKVAAAPAPAPSAAAPKVGLQTAEGAAAPPQWARYLLVAGGAVLFLSLFKKKKAADVVPVAASPSRVEPKFSEIL